MTATSTTTSVALLTLLAAASLTACSAPDDSSSDPTPSDTPTTAPDASATPVPVDDTVLLAIDTVATEPGGASLALSARVHASLPVSDPAVAEQRELLLADCGPDFVTEERLADENWGIVRIDIVAQQVGATTWPTDVPVPLVTAPRGEPGAAAVAVSGDPLTIAQDPAGELGPCLVAPFVEGEGEASVALGIRHDYTSPDSQGLFWNGYRYGFTELAFGEPTGVTFTDCEIERTPLADDLSAPEIGYEQVSNARACSAGIPRVT